MVGKLREPEARIIALRIAASSPNGEATTTRIKERLPDYRELTLADLSESPTRRGERVWQQIVGNVISHRATRTSIFSQGLAERTEDGIRITEKGRVLLNSNGF